MSMKWNGAAVEAAVRAGAFRGVVRGTESVHEEGTNLIQDGPKTGRIYAWVGVDANDPRKDFLIQAPQGHKFWARLRAKPHQASAPGEAPATDFGRLVQSGRTRYDRSALLGTASWSTDYARYLEFGTRYMAPRPYARPALQNKNEEIRRDVATEIARALRR